MLVRKLGAPGNPEFAIGAVDESGWTYLTPYAAAAGADSEYVDRERAAQLEVLRRRRATYTPGREPVRTTGGQVIVVDDGLATGASMIAALHAIREQSPHGSSAGCRWRHRERWSCCSPMPTKWCAWRRRPDSGQSGSSTATFHRSRMRR